MSNELRREDPPMRGRPAEVTAAIVERLGQVRLTPGVWFAVWDFGYGSGASSWKANRQRGFPGFVFRTHARPTGSTLYARYVGPPVEGPDDPDADRPLGPDHPAYRKGAE